MLSLPREVRIDVLQFLRRVDLLAFADTSRDARRTLKEFHHRLPCYSLVHNLRRSVVRVTRIKSPGERNPLVVCGFLDHERVVCEDVNGGIWLADFPPPTAQQRQLQLQKGDASERAIADDERLSLQFHIPGSRGYAINGVLAHDDHRLFLHRLCEVYVHPQRNGQSQRFPKQPKDVFANAWRTETTADPVTEDGRMSYFKFRGKSHASVVVLVPDTTPTTTQGGATGGKPGTGGEAQAASEPAPTARVAAEFKLSADPGLTLEMFVAFAESRFFVLYFGYDRLQRRLVSCRLVDVNLDSSNQQQPGEQPCHRTIPIPSGARAGKGAEGEEGGMGWFGQLTMQRGVTTLYGYNNRPFLLSQGIDPPHRLTCVAVFPDDPSRTGVAWQVTNVVSYFTVPGGDVIVFTPTGIVVRDILTGRVVTSRNTARALGFRWQRPKWAEDATAIDPDVEALTRHCLEIHDVPLHCRCAMRVPSLIGAKSGQQHTVASPPTGKSSVPSTTAILAVVLQRPKELPQPEPKGRNARDREVKAGGHVGGCEGGGDLLGAPQSELRRMLDAALQAAERADASDTEQDGTDTATNQAGGATTGADTDQEHTDGPSGRMPGSGSEDGYPYSESEDDDDDDDGDDQAGDDGAGGDTDGDGDGDSEYDAEESAEMLDQVFEGQLQQLEDEQPFGDGEWMVVSLLPIL